jgi:hypothetical protein
LDEVLSKNLENFMRAGLHSVKATLLKEIETLEKTGQPQRSVFNQGVDIQNTRKIRTVAFCALRLMSVKGTDA